METLIGAAKKALLSGEVKLIIGYTPAGNSGRTRPFIARTPDEAELLTFNHNCQNNLAVYLTRIPKPSKGKTGIVVKGCDVRSINALIQENKIRRDDIYIIGAACSGIAADQYQPFDKSNTMDKCISCTTQIPASVDVVTGEAEPYEKPDDRTNAELQRLGALTPEERFSFWQNEFEKCIKCYACRQACALCYCGQCITDKTTPRWIESSSSPRGNFSWNLIRAFHLSGRCTGCGECERACPADIPLMLLNRKMGMVAMKEFGYRHGSNPDDSPLVGSYELSDNNSFFK